MNFEEFAAKPLLATGGVTVPPSQIALTAEDAASAAQAIGPCVVKAQVPTGKRGKAGGIKLASNANEAREHAANILGMDIGGFTVGKLRRQVGHHCGVQKAFAFQRRYQSLCQGGAGNHWLYAGGCFCTFCFNR